MKVVINTCYGGFNLSHEGMMRYYELKGIKVYPFKDEYHLWTYSTVPEDEYDALQKEAEETGDYKKINSVYLSLYDVERNDPALIQTVEEMGKAANGDYSELKIVDIPDDITWVIKEYDGMEHIAESHRTWY